MMKQLIQKIKLGWIDITCKCSNLWIDIKNIYSFEAIKEKLYIANIFIVIFPFSFLCSIIILYSMTLTAKDWYNIFVYLMTGIPTNFFKNLLFPEDLTVDHKQFEEFVKATMKLPRADFSDEVKQDELAVYIEKLIDLKLLIPLFNFVMPEIIFVILAASVCVVTFSIYEYYREQEEQLEILLQQADKLLQAQSKYKVPKLEPDTWSSFLKIKQTKCPTFLEQCETIVLHNTSIWIIVSFVIFFLFLLLLLFIKEIKEEPLNKKK